MCMTKYCGLSGWNKDEDKIINGTDVVNCKLTVYVSGNIICHDKTC